MASNESAHVVELIEAYLAGGLEPGERAAFESHVQSCPICAAEIAKAREADGDLRTLFCDARPKAGFEDRIVQKLRFASSLRWPIIHPMVKRVATGIAAAVLVGTAGIVVSSSIDRGSFSEGQRSVAVADADGDGIIDRGFVNLPSTQPSYYAGVAITTGPIARAAGKPLLEAEKRGDRAALADQLPALGNQLDRDGKKDASASYGLTDQKSERLNEYSYFRPETDLNRQLSTSDDRGVNKLRQLTRDDLADKAKQTAATPAQNDMGRQMALGAIVTNGRAENAPQSTPPAPSQPLTEAPATQANVMSGRKVIRDGTMQFEVERFDDALLRITKLVVEQGGLVATTDSDKLPNGKMKGTVTLRVPPEHLDTLVLTLRGIGDLKSQKIGAEDVTKHYTDLESELRAAHAMQERLLEIIKTGKGQIKDLLEAEKQLGVWREKIEQIEGEKRFLDNQITLSTLRVELCEKDIQTPSYASESEQVSMSLETEKVDEAYEKARAAIEAAKGRILQAEMKQFDAGQFGATIQAAVPPDAAEETIARLRQLSGRIAHFSRESKRTTQNGAAPLNGITTLKREDAVISMQIYNLANIAPRRTIAVTLAAGSVDHAYQQVLEQIRSASGRVVTSSLTKPDANQQSADIDFQVASDKADSLDDALRGFGEIMRHDSTENPDTANVTEAKRGFHLRIVGIAAVPARESQEIQLAAADVPTAYTEILTAVNAAGGRVLQSDLKEQDPHDKTASIVFEMPRAALASINSTIAKAAQIMTRTVNRSPDSENTLDSKVRLALGLSSAEKLPPRETTSIREEVSDVERAADDLVNAAISADGRRIGNGQTSQDRAGHMTAEVIVDVPMDKAASILDQVERMGHRRGKQVSFDTSVPDGPLSRERIEVTFSNWSASLGGEESTWDAIRHGLETSGLGLRWSVQMLVIGVCFVAPWVVLLWGIWKLARRRNRRNPEAPAPAPAL